MNSPTQQSVVQDPRIDFGLQLSSHRRMFVSKLLPLAITGAAVAIAGSAVAASSKTHVMNVALPDGSAARIEYVGDVPPKVTVAPSPMGTQVMPFPTFEGFDRMAAEIQRQSQEMVRQAEDMARGTGGAAPFIAAYGDMPAGHISTTVVTTSRNGVSCTRTTEVVSQGEGKPPKVTSNFSGTCDGSAAPTAPAAPAAPTGRINRT